MFNKTYQLRAVKKAGGGRELARQSGLCIPWAGIFRAAKSRRPVVAIARSGGGSSAQGELFHRPDDAIRTEIAAKRCENPTGQLRGTQLSLFLEPAEENFYRPIASTLNFERPLADLFPEAYE